MLKITRDQTVFIAVFTAVACNGLFLSANGLFMLAAPAVWYVFVPGVTDTGFYNQHFIRDIRIIQLFLGVAFGIAIALPERRTGLLGGGDTLALRACHLPPVASRRRHLRPRPLTKRFQWVTESERYDQSGAKTAGNRGFWSLQGISASRSRVFRKISTSRLGPVVN
jgi:hypothetical protein